MSAADQLHDYFPKVARMVENTAGKGLGSEGAVPFGGGMTLVFRVSALEGFND
jgi:hypothetical protein